MPHPRILMAWKHWLEAQDQLLLYGDAFFQLSHFADVRVDMKHDERSLFV
jgi:hypothetical protein